MTFRCFSPELAAVLSGFASSANGLIVKTINVEVSGTLTEVASTPGPITPTYVQPTPVQPTISAEAAERARYGDMGRYGQGNRYGEGSGKFPGYPTVPQQPYVAAQPAAPKGGGGLPVVVDEKQLKVTLQLVAVKLINTNLLASAK
jgi:hypothetical protein